MVLLNIKKEGNEEQKKAVAESASDLIEDNMVIGLGTGSTVSYLIEEIGKKIEEKKTKIEAVCSSFETKHKAKKQGIYVREMDDVDEIDLCIDGADQVDEELNLVKGGGAAHFREKILASYSNKFICIIDETKLTDTLKDPIPIEVHPFSYKPVMDYLKNKMNSEPVLRESLRKDGPLITDNGNFVVDTDFGLISNPDNLNNELNDLVGVIEHGLFIDLVDEVFVAGSSGINIMKK